MAFPASQQTLDSALTTVMSIANRTKSSVQQVRDETAAGDVERTKFPQLMFAVQRAIDTFDQASTVPGIAQYARDQFDNQTFDIAAEFTAMRAAAVTLRDWIFNNLPKDAGSGAVLLETLNADGTRTPLVVTTAQTAGFRTEADAFIATIS